MELKSYKTVKTASEVETVINKSRFISRCFPVCDEKEALALLSSVREGHADASHNCYAYKIGARGELSRFSDDGEPGGTAGLPIMEALNKSGFTNALCVVTRYFGGILLGAGGLARAYSGGAAAAIKAAGTAFYVPGAVIEFEVDYSRYNILEGCIRERCEVKSLEFLESVRFTVLVECERANDFISWLVERANGRVRPRVIGEDYIIINS